MSKTATRTFGEVLADKSSNLYAAAENATRVMSENTAKIDALVAAGYTREEAWAIGLGFRK